MKGIILKGIGGFYYVKSSNEVYECKARGHFRNDKISPIAGDFVEFSINDNAENTIDEIFERKNYLIRPPVANVDYALLVSSMHEPELNLYNLDKMAVICEANNIIPIIIITKVDLDNNIASIRKNYEKTGYKCYFIDNRSNKTDYSEIVDLVSNNICFISGNTGVGKSTIINNAFDLDLATSAISLKLGRGKHTTRTSELFKYKDGYIIDSPGFSSIDLKIYPNINCDELFNYFPEFEKYYGQCKFSNCSHTCEKGCAIIDAVNNEEISQIRHNNYVEMYNELKDIKKWQ